MKRERIEQLKDIFDEAWGAMRNEWDFGEFKVDNDIKEAIAEEIFAELLSESEN